jgi:3-oxoacyl-[acyl-carrier protein] reductase
MQKNIIVTGASKGVGLVIAKTLLEKGYGVFAINRTIGGDLSDLAANYPDRLKILQYDLSNTEDIRKIVFKEFIGLTTPIHGFVNNAAMAYDDIVTNLNYEPLEQMYKVNVFSPMLFTKYAIRQMLFGKIKGSIIHISSISVHTGYKGLAMYASSKGALEAFSKNTAREWGERGIRSNSLVAGFMETNMSGTLSDSQKNRIYQRTSLKQPTSIQSVADTVEFLLSNASESITGQNIHVDAGTI